MNELEPITDLASSDVYLHVSLVFALVYAAYFVWAAGRPPKQSEPSRTVAQRQL